MEISQLIEEIKAAQNLQFQAYLRLSRELQSKQKEDLEFLKAVLEEDLQLHRKSLSEIVDWYQEKREQLFSKALEKLHQLNAFTADPQPTESKNSVEYIDRIVKGTQKNGR